MERIPPGAGTAIRLGSGCWRCRATSGSTSGPLAELGAHAVEVRVPADLAAVDALVLPGGESTTMSLLLESLRAARAARATGWTTGMPAFGTCAGMILLAAEVVDGRPDQRGFGAIDIGGAAQRLRPPGRLLRDRPGRRPASTSPFHAVFIRAPVVERAGPEVEVLARVAGTDG